MFRDCRGAIRAKLPDHHDFVFRCHGHDVDTIREISDKEIMCLTAFARSKPLASQPKQPVFHERFIMCARIFADP